MKRQSSGRQVVVVPLVFLAGFANEWHLAMVSYLCATRKLSNTTHNQISVSLFREVGQRHSHYGNDASLFAVSDSSTLLVVAKDELTYQLTLGATVGESSAAPEHSPRSCDPISTTQALSVLGCRLQKSPSRQARRVLELAEPTAARAANQYHQQHCQTRLRQTTSRISPLKALASQRCGPHARRDWLLYGYSIVKGQSLR